MNIKEIQTYEKYRHELLMTMIEIIEQSNLQDLKRLWSILIDNKFATPIVGMGEHQGGDI